MSVQGVQGVPWGFRVRISAIPSKRRAFCLNSRCSDPAYAVKPAAGDHGFSGFGAFRFYTKRRIPHVYALFSTLIKYQRWLVGFGIRLNRAWAPRMILISRRVAYRGLETAESVFDQTRLVGRTVVFVYRRDLAGKQLSNRWETDNSQNRNVSLTQIKRSNNSIKPRLNTTTEK